MRLEEAIDHLEEMLADENHEWSCEECRKEHEQLLGWLKELKGLRLENEKGIMYLCDRKKPCKERCEKYHHCKHTSDITHAKNFHRVEEVTDREVYEENNEHCIASFSFDREQLEEIVEERVIKPIQNGELVVKEEERPHGEWITTERGYECSECGALHSDDYPFCHMCGADMRGREGG